MTTPLNDSPAPKPQGWWIRNWPWAVPLLVLALAGAALGLVVFIFSLIKSSDAYQQPVAAAKASPEVKAALGEPVTENWYVMGKLKFVNDQGYANLQIPLSGPNGDATLYVIGTRTQGIWTYDKMVVHPNNGPEINLLQPLPPPEKPNEDD
jgi:hypothetical protein